MRRYGAVAAVLYALTLSGCMAGIMGGVEGYTEVTREVARWEGSDRKAVQQSVGQCMQDANAGATFYKWPAEMAPDRHATYRRCMEARGYTAHRDELRTPK